MLHILFLFLSIRSVLYYSSLKTGFLLDCVAVENAVDVNREKWVLWVYADTSMGRVIT